MDLFFHNNLVVDVNRVRENNIERIFRMKRDRRKRDFKHRFFIFTNPLHLIGVFRLLQSGLGLRLGLASLHMMEVFRLDLVCFEFLFWVYLDDKTIQKDRESLN